MSYETWLEKVDRLESILISFFSTLQSEIEETSLS